jgi:carbon starvation protein
MRKVFRQLLWVMVALAGALAYATLALRRGEPLNSAYILVAALCSYAIGYRFYSKWIAARVLSLNDRRATPCEVHDDGKDFVKTNKWIVFGHHFAAISGPGPLVGPVLAAQFGYLPGTLWILIGVTLGGAVQDFVVLFSSLRRDGKSLAQMVKEEMNTAAGLLAILAIVAIMIILLAVLALVVVKALAESPWGVFTVSATIPIAMLMGGYLRFWRVGKVMEASAFGVLCLLLAVWGGKLVHETPALARLLGLQDITLAWALIIYGLAASILPVWLLLAPRDYLSTFMKLGTIFALALGIFVVLPNLQMPAISRFVDGSGLVVAGKVFPFCFITIACGAISGFHTLIASGTTPKLLTRESYSRPIGYGAMCLESLVAIMALIAACTLDPGVYLSMNVRGPSPETVAKVTSLGFPVTEDHMNQLASQIGEKSLFGRTGGAATLAVGMAQIFSKAVNGRGLDLWYHFAIMFEALFILTTLDAGTRVGRYMLQDAFGQIWKPLGETRNIGANILASVVMVGGWGYFLIQGVRDPLGGINSLWPLFGIANQMLAGIALCLATTIILKMNLAKGYSPQSTVHNPQSTSVPWVALTTLVPLVWLLAVTMTAGVEKIWNSDPRIGFLAQAKALERKIPDIQLTIDAAQAAGEANAIKAAETALRTNRVQRFNNLLDAAVAATFMGLIVGLVLLSGREWFLLLARRKPSTPKETAPIWLPEHALEQRQALHAASLLALALALAKELSGEARLERAQHTVLYPLPQPAGRTNARSFLSAVPSHLELIHFSVGGGGTAAITRTLNPVSFPTSLQSRAERRQQLYLALLEQRFNRVTRCC